MTQVIKPVRYFVTEVRDLPISWVSAGDISLAGAYEKECKKEGKTADPQRIAELLGNNVVHLRQHNLLNGLRYVTIRQADGTEVFSDSKYAGLTSCNCGAIHDSPAVTSATWALQDKPDLGNSFRLQGTSASENPHKYGATKSTVEKEFVAPNGKKVKVYYSLSPDFEGDGGSLSFNYVVSTPGILQYKIKSDGELKDKTHPITSKLVKVRIWSPTDSDVCQSSITIAHNLPNSPYQGLYDQVEFKFDNNSGLEEVVGISQGSNQNPEWADPKVLDAIRKGSNTWFHYHVWDREAQVLATAVFGKDITQLRHDTRGTLDALMVAAIKEMDIDLNCSIGFR